MRVNVYAEELTDRVEIIQKTGDGGHTFTGLRFYLQLPVTVPITNNLDNANVQVTQVSGPFVHHPGDDDSAAVTFWGKRQMIPLLERALKLLKEEEGK